MYNLLAETVLQCFPVLLFRQLCKRKVPVLFGLLEYITVHDFGQSVVKQSGKENNSFQEGKYDGKYDCNIADGILGNSLLSRTTSLSKILRFNVSSVTIRILSSLKYQFPKEKWTGLPYYTNLTKFSYRYYVYTLGRILI